MLKNLKWLEDAKEWICNFPILIFKKENYMHLKNEECIIWDYHTMKLQKNYEKLQKKEGIQSFYKQGN